MKDKETFSFRPLAILLGCSFFLLLLIFGIWHIAIPLDMIKDKIEDSFSSIGIKAEIDGLRKGIFYNLSADKILCYQSGLYLRSTPMSESSPRLSNDTSMITISDLKAGLDPLSVFKLRPAILFNGRIANGEVKGVFILGRGLNITLKEIELSGLGFMASFTRKGTVSGVLSASLKESKAELKFSIDDAVLKDITGEIYIPLSLFSRAKGVIVFNNGSVNLRSLFLEGDGISGRFTDSMAKNLEVMVNSNFVLPQVVEIALYKYKKAPGYYIIPFSIRR